MRNRDLAWGWILGVGVLSMLIGRAAGQDTSTPEERMQWVEVTHKLESAPLDDSVNKQGEAAFKRLSDVHDVHVLLCPALLSEFNGMKYAYAHTITRQYMLASGAFQIENPDKMADAKATALAGVESVLKTYQAILQQKPDAKAKALDDLLKKQRQGTRHRNHQRRLWGSVLFFGVRPLDLSRLVVDASAGPLCESHQPADAESLRDGQGQPPELYGSGWASGTVGGGYSSS